MTPVAIETTGATTRVRSPYNSLFVAFAKSRGGRWDATSRAWVFDARDESAVRDECLRVYGNDGTRSASLVDLRISWPEGGHASCEALGIAGRTIAAATSRDSGARQGEGVVVLEGGFRSSGSARNWRTEALPGTVVVVRDLPRPLVESILANPRPGSGRVYVIEE